MAAIAPPPPAANSRSAASSAPSAAPAQPAARGLGTLAGVGAALVLVFAILALRLASGALSLVEVVADGFLLVLPGALGSAIIDTFQKAAKPLLYLGIAVGTVAVGALLGRWYAGAPGWRRALAVALGAWGVFGLGLYPLIGAGFFGASLQAGPVWHATSLLALFLLFAGVLRGLYGLFAARRRPAHSTPLSGATRRDLVRALGLASLAALATGLAWRLIPRGEDAPVARGPLGPLPVLNPAPYDLAGLSAEVTPTADFYTVSKNFIDPSVNASGWKLKIDGLVERPFELTYDQLRALPASEGYYTLMCISNEVGGDLWGNAHWKGVKLRSLLEQAGVRDGAYKAVFTAADDYRDSIRIERALHPDTLLAWEMNGAPLTKTHGFPARLLIPDIYGMKNVKWLTGITVARDDTRGYWQTRGWDDEANYQVAARLDVPRARATFPTGTLALGGVAFAGERVIQRVEVSADGGQTWQDAEVKPGLSPYTWQLWRAMVPVAPGVRELQVRATDGRGTPQTARVAPPFPSGSTGYHTVDVLVA